jgi:dihydrofolate reductase
MKSMRKLVVGTFTTLDGVMQAPGGPNEDRDGDFPHGGWLVPYFDAKFAELMTEWTKRAGAFLLGRKTYEIFAESWPKATDPADENGTALNTRPKFVASRTLGKVSWNNSILLKGDVAKRLRSLRHRKAEGNRPSSWQLYEWARAAANYTVTTAKC